MPKIPVFQEKQRVNASNPTGFQSSSQARLAGDSLSQAGRGIASLGARFMEVDRRSKEAERRLANQDYKNALTRRLQDAKVEIERSDVTGDKFVEMYDELSSEIQADLSDEFAEKYNGQYGQDFQVSGDGIIVGNRAGMMADAFKKREQFIKKAVDQTTSEMNAAVYSNPALIDSVSVDYTQTIAGSMQDLGASEAKIKEAHTTGQRKLVDSAMRGYIEQDKYNEARLLVLRDYKGLYNTEDQTKRLDEIKDAELDSKRLKEQEVSKLERDLEAKVKKDQLAKSSQLMAAYAMAAQNGDNKQIYKVKQQIIEAGKRGDILYSHFGGLLSKSDQGFKEANASTAYEISRRIYRAKTNTELQGIRSIVKAKVDSGRLNPADGQKFERTLHNMLTKVTSNPRTRQRYSAYRTRLEAFTKTEEYFKTLGDFNKKSNLMRIKALAESDYMNDVADGIDPELSFRRTVLKHFTGTEALESFPGYSGKMINNEEKLEKFIGWKNGKFQNNPSQMQKADRYIEEVRDAIEVDTMIKEAQAKRVQEVAKEKLGQQSDRVELDMETLAKPRGAMQTLIDTVNNIFGEEPDANSGR